MITEWARTTAFSAATCAEAAIMVCTVSSAAARLAPLPAPAPADAAPSQWGSNAPSGTLAVQGGALTDEQLGVEKATGRAPVAISGP